MIITAISELWRQTLYGTDSVVPDSEGNGKDTRQLTLDRFEPNYTEHQLMQQFTSAQYVLRFAQFEFGIIQESRISLLVFLVPSSPLTPKPYLQMTYILYLFPKHPYIVCHHSWI
jgi:hypothetical protein